MKVRKVLSTIAAAAVLVSTIGCSTEKKAEVKDKELSLFLWTDGCAFKEDYPVFKEAEKKTGVHMKGYLSKSTTDPDSAFNIMIASGELADVVTAFGRDRFYEYGEKGAYIPLNDLIEEHAPNVKKLLEEHPDWKEFITAIDGNIYYLPFIEDGDASEGWFIRQDWLDKLGMKAPENIEEYYKVLKAFKENDPNGNGVADEIPYFSRTPSTGIDALFSLWNVNTASFVIEDGVPKLSVLLPRYKDAVKTIAQWYKEGLIDTEIYTRGSNSREYMLGNNVGGSTHDWFGSTALYNDKLKNDVPGINFAPITPPAGYDGVKRELRRRMTVTENGCAITSSCKDPITAIKWLDFWYSEEGRILQNYGVEGVDWTMIDGKPKFTESVLNNDKAVAQYLASIGAQTKMSFRQDFEYEKQWLNEAALNAMQIYIDGDYFAPLYVAPLMEKDETSEYHDIMINLETLISEQVQKWILGNEDVDATYDKFNDNLKTMKVDRAVELVQKYYK